MDPAAGLRFSVIQGVNKMKCMKIYAILFAGLFAVITQASAATISFDITTDYLPGDNTITLDLNLSSVDERLGVKGFRLDFDYDPSELSFQSYENFGQSVFSDYYSIEDTKKPFKDDPVNGILENFFVRKGRPGPHEYLEIDTPVRIGSFTFSILGGATVSDGITDFNLREITYLSFGDGTAPYFKPDVTGNAFDPGIDVGGASAVPEPASALLFAAGLLCLAGIRRKID